MVSRILTSLAVVVFLTAGFAQGDEHAPWPANWSNWSDPALWVTVGNPGNAPDTRYISTGGVSYTYQIGKYEVTAGQYTNFLNAKATLADIYGLYNTQMQSDVAGCHIQRSGSGTVVDPYVYSVTANWANRPVNYVSSWDALRFTNWLNNGQGNGDTETGAYTLNGYNDIGGRTIKRNSEAKIFLPSSDEWYKAAYYDPNKPNGAGYYDYATRTSLPPGRDMSELTNPGNNANYSGSPYPIDSPYFTTVAGEFQLSDSSYGTFDQGGNVAEWTETFRSWDTDALRMYWGGSLWADVGYMSASAYGGVGFPTNEAANIGFRVACVPEPSSIVMLVGIALTALLCWWRKRA